MGEHLNSKLFFILTILPLLIFSISNHITLYPEGTGFVERTYTINETGIFTKNIEELKNVNINDVSISSINSEIYLLGNFYSEKNIEVKKSLNELLNESLNKNINMIIESKPRNGILLWYDNERIGIEENQTLIVIKMNTIDEIRFNNISSNKNEIEKKYEMKMFGKSNNQNSKIKLSYPKNTLSWEVIYTINNNILTQEANIKNNDDEEYLNTTLKLTMTKPYFSTSSSSRYYYPAVASLKSDMIEYAMEDSSYEFVTSLTNTLWSYELKDKIDLTKKSTQKITIFNEPIQLNKSYIWDSNKYSSTVNIVYSFKNNRKEILPGGKIRIFEKDVLMGENTIDNLRYNQSTEIFVSPAIQFTISKNKIYDNVSPLISGYKHDVKYEIEITNYGDSEDIVELRDKIYEKENLQIKNYSIEPYYSENNEIKWKISIKPGETKKVSYEYSYTSKY